MATYHISRMELGSDKTVMLTEEEYRAARNAYLCLENACYIEEKFAYLIDNYFELETEVLTACLKNPNHISLPFEERVQQIHIFIRRIINVLTSCRLYLDHAAHHLKTFGELNEHLGALFTTATRHAYDNFFSYRFLEELRNYVQHRGLPITGITTGDALIDTNHPALGSELTITLNVKVQDLVEDKKFKSKIAQELQKTGVRSLDLRPQLREYVSLLASVNEELRSELKPPIRQWHATIKSTIEKFSNENNGLDSGLSLEARDENGSTYDHMHFSLGAFDRHQRLVKLYFRMNELANRYVSARPPNRLPKFQHD